MDRKILTAEEGLEVLTDRGGGAHGQTNPADKGEHIDKQIPPIEVVTLVEKRALVHPGR